MLVLTGAMAGWTGNKNDFFVGCHQSEGTRNQDHTQGNENSLHRLEFFESNVFELDGEGLAHVQLQRQHS